MTPKKDTKEDWFREKRIMIAGGLGFIGSNLARRPVRMGAKVLLLDNIMPNSGANLFNIAGLKDKIRINISDVQGIQSMCQLVQRQDYLFNLAGLTSLMDSMHDPYTDLEINCRAQLSILEACRRRAGGQVKLLFGTLQLSISLNDSPGFASGSWLCEVDG